MMHSFIHSTFSGVDRRDRKLVADEEGDEEKAPASKEWRGVGEGEGNRGKDPLSLLG